MRLIFSIVIIFMLVPPCYGFEKEKHRGFSDRAVDVYKTCTGRALPKELGDAFATASVEEDTWGLSRARNWHYYNRDKKIGRYWKVILCNGSNEHIFNDRVKKLDDMLLLKAPSQDIYEATGRLAHHIQDMSAPPHVMPINHLLCDKVDHYVLDPVFVDHSKICKNVNGPVVGPHELLDEAAKNTLDAVARPVEFADRKTVENETWMKFWGGPDDSELSGFKTYGEYGNRFGVIPPCNSSACQAYDKQVYDRFYSDCYLRAVTDTVRLLIYLDKRLTELKKPLN